MGGGSTDRDAFNAFGSSSQYWCLSSLCQQFYALNSTELGLCYSGYFPRENTNCLVQ